MGNTFEQLSLLPDIASEKDDCSQCRFFAELKEPFVRSDGAVIYGYCFQAGDRDDSPGMGKGYAVFLPDGRCKKFKSRVSRKTSPDKETAQYYNQEEEI